MTRRTYIELEMLLFLGVLTIDRLDSVACAGATGDRHHRGRQQPERCISKNTSALRSHNKDINVRVIYGPSQTLSKQIEEGAPIDVFLPSQVEEIDQLEKKGLVIQGTSVSMPAPRWS